MTRRDQAEKLWVYLSQMDDEFIEEAGAMMAQSSDNVYGFGIAVPASHQEARQRAAKYGATFAGLSSVVAAIYVLRRLRSSRKRARAA